jgi:hypothetical protein
MCHKCWQNYRYRQIAYGRWESSYTDIAPVLSHMDLLLESGIGVVRLADLAGLPRHTVQQLRRKGRVSCSTRTSSAILAVSPPLIVHGEEVADGAVIPSAGTVRRLQALAVAGYGITFLADELGMKFQYVSHLRAGNNQQVTANIARRVDALFRKYELIPGPSRATANRAILQGWAPALAWDEDTIDDPQANPDRGAENNDWLDAYFELRDMGVSKEVATERLGLKWSTVRDRLKRLGRVA